MHAILKVHKFIGTTNEVGQRRPGICYGSVVKAREAVVGDLVVRWTQQWLRAQRWEIHCSIRCHWTLLFIYENIKESLAYLWRCFSEKHCGWKSSDLLFEVLGCYGDCRRFLIRFTKQPKPVHTLNIQYKNWHRQKHTMINWSLKKWFYMTFYLSSSNLNPLLRNMLVFAMCLLHKLQYSSAYKQVGRDFLFSLEGYEI